MASDRVVQSAPGAEETEALLFDLASRLIKATAEMPETRIRLLNGGLLEIDIFANNQEVTKRVIARLRLEH
jgi:hypothetical protein